MLAYPATGCVVGVNTSGSASALSSERGGVNVWVCDQLEPVKAKRQCVLTLH